MVDKIEAVGSETGEKGIKIKYNGKYPTLCMGKFVVVVDGKTWEFPENCLVSGGSVGFDSDGKAVVTTGVWSLCDWPKGFPDKYKKDTLTAINNEIEYGCCGGCL